MLLGFISLLLVVFEDRITTICIPESVASTWNPCGHSDKIKGPKGYIDKCAEKVSKIHTHVYISITPSLIFFCLTLMVINWLSFRYCKFSRGVFSFIESLIFVLVFLQGEGQVAFVSEYGIHQLHIFVFVLAIFHILQCIITLTLGRTKVLLYCLYYCF